MMKCQVKRGTVDNLLAIPAGAYSCDQPCPNMAVARVTPKPDSRFCLPELFMCQTCIDEAVQDLGDTINIEPITQPVSIENDVTCPICGSLTLERNVREYEKEISLALAALHKRKE